jgi:glutathione S-transferase
VIRDGDFVLWESNTICRYLVGMHGRDDLLPPDPRRRARVEQWMDWMATDLDRVARYPFLALTRSMPPNPEQARLDADIAAWNRCMGVLAARIESTGAFVAGEDFTLADINVGLALNRWLKTPLERPPLAALDAYRERLLGHPGFVAWAENGPA